MSLNDALRELQQQAATHSNGFTRMPVADALRALAAAHTSRYTVHNENGRPKVITVAVELRIPVE